MLVAVVAGCSDATNDVDIGIESYAVEDSEVLAAVPDDLRVNSVAVADEAGWVVGSRGGSGELWRVHPDGVQLMSELDVGALQIEGAQGGVNGVVIRCAEGDDECLDGWWAELWRFNHEGEVEGQVVLHESDEPRQSAGDGVRLLGDAGDLTWVLVNSEMIGVDEAGGIARQAPTVRGLICVLDDDIYGIGAPDRLLRDDDDRRGAADDGPEVVESSSDQSPDRQLLEVMQYRDGDWSPVAGSTHSFDVGGSVTTRCGDGSLRAEFSGVDLLVGSWSPSTGWLDVHDVASGEVDALGLDNAAIGGQGAVVLSPDDGAVYERQIDGTYRATSLNLPDLSQPGQMAPRLEAAASSRLLVACVFAVAPDQDRGTTCDATEREAD